MKPFPCILAAALAPALSHAAMTFPGNGDAGFGGAVGTGSLTLEDNGITVSATFTRGTGGFDNALVLYLDTGAGGITSTIDLTDSADGLRSAISGFDGGDNRSTLTFEGGLTPNFAIAFDQNFAGLWQIVENGSHTFVAGLGLNPTGTNTAEEFSFSFNVEDIGLTANSGQSFDFVTTFVSTTGFRSTESIGNDVSGEQGWNPFNSGDPQSFTIVPEPSVALLGGLGLLAMFRRRR